jgi:large subunit ribosomal protein L22
MKINPDKLRRAMDQAGANVDTLATALERPALNADQAASALRNWLAGRNHPRARTEDAKALAAALGVEVRDLATFVSTSRFVRSSPRKARLVADLIRGKRVDQAMSLLEFSDKRAAQMFKKTLQTAMADAEQADADVTALVVAESRVDAGMTIKRFQPKDRGRAHPIRKRTSHLIIGVEEVG